MIGRILLEGRQSKLFIFILGVGITLSTYQFYTNQTAAVEILYKPTLKTCLMLSVSLLRWIEILSVWSQKILSVTAWVEASLAVGSQGLAQDTVNVATSSPAPGKGFP